MTEKKTRIISGQGNYAANVFQCLCQMEKKHVELPMTGPNNTRTSRTVTIELNASADFFMNRSIPSVNVNLFTSQQF